jgi:MscS family membrane protein
MQPPAIGHLPALFLRSGPYGLSVWQWVGLPLLMLCSWAFGVAVSVLLRAILGHALRRTSAEWDHAAIARLGAPLTLASALGIAYGCAPLLELTAKADQAADRVVRTGLFVAFFWALVRVVDVLGRVLALSEWAKSHAVSRSLVPLAARVGKVIVVALAVVAVLSQLGYPVASLIAGLGIGGLALALAAQKTVEHLFGAFAIGIDQPFREGDFIKFENVMGVVESIGLRSTRIRTLERTVVAVPNGKLADARIETFAARDRIRFACVLPLVYGTTPAQLESVVAQATGLLRDHPKACPAETLVAVAELGAHALMVEVIGAFATTDWLEFVAIRQDMLVGLLRIVEACGTSIAMPTQTVLLCENTRRPVPQNPGTSARFGM